MLLDVLKARKGIFKTILRKIEATIMDITLPFQGIFSMPHIKESWKINKHIQLNNKDHNDYVAWCCWISLKCLKFACEMKRKSRWEDWKFVWKEIYKLFVLEAYNSEGVKMIVHQCLKAIIAHILNQVLRL